MNIVTAMLTGSAAAALVSGVFSLLLWKLNRTAARAEQTDHVKSALRILLYDRIKHLGKAHMDRGHISSEELEDIIAMHRVYHDQLGGNGFLDSIMEQVIHLPIHH